MPHHELKILPEHYEKVMLRKKTFEVRKNDRDFQVGDTLELREFNSHHGLYTGSILKRRVTYILRGPAFGVESGYCVMSVVPLSDW